MLFRSLNGQDATTDYDGFCRVTRVDRPGGDFTLMTYSLGSQPYQWVKTERKAPTSSAADKIQSVSFLDGLGRGYKTVSDGPNATFDTITSETEFNERGGIKSTSAPYYPGDPVKWTSYDYDGINRLTGIDHPGTAVSSVSYALAAATVRDILDITSTDEIGREQKFAIDAYGNLTKRTKVKVTGAVTTELVTQYQRDPLGRAVTIIDPKLNQWNYTYDNLGRRTEVDDPDLGTWLYTFDNASRLKTQRDARGVRTTLSYDDLSRVTAKVVQDLGGTGIAMETTSNTYDDTGSVNHSSSFFNLGRLTDTRRIVPAHARGVLSIAAVDVTQRFDYDLAGRLQKLRFDNINGGTRSLDYTYWPDGSPRDKRLADSITWVGTHNYDLAGRLASITNGTGSGPTYLASTMLYNAQGQMAKIIHGNDVTTRFYYDANRFFLNSQETRDGIVASSPLLLGFDYTRNDAGMITEVTASGGTAAQNTARSWNYTYDGIGQLLTADRQDTAGVELTYAYDEASNMTRNSGICSISTAMLYPPGGPTAVRPHAPSSTCGTSASYDANGNTLTYDADGPGNLAAQLPRAIVYDGGILADPFWTNLGWTES